MGGAPDALRISLTGFAPAAWGLVSEGTLLLAALRVGRIGGCCMHKESSGNFLLRVIEASGSFSSLISRLRPYSLEQELSGNCWLV